MPELQRVFTELVEWPVDKIDPDPLQPREHFDEAKLAELAESIKKEGGVIQPSVVRPHPTDSERVVLIAGERRWRSVKMLGWPTLTCVLRKGDMSTFEISLVENLHRVDLNPIEQAKSFLRLRKEEDRSLRYMSELTGLSIATISNRIQLLKLPQEIQDLIAKDRLPQLHALNLRGLKIDEKEMIRLAHELISGKVPQEISERMIRITSRGEKIRTARLPATGNELIQRIIRQLWRIRPLKSEVQVLEKLPLNRQRGAWEGLGTRSQAYLENAIIDGIQQLTLLQTLIERYKAPRLEGEIVDVADVLKRKRGFAGLIKILSAMFYEGSRVRINVSRQRLGSQLHSTDPAYISATAYKAFSALRDFWDVVTITSDPAPEEFILFVRRLRRDFPATRTFPAFIKLIGDRNTSVDSFDLSSFLLQSVKKPEVLAQSA